MFNLGTESITLNCVDLDGVRSSRYIVFLFFYFFFNVSIQIKGRKEPISTIYTCDKQQTISLYTIVYEYQILKKVPYNHLIEPTNSEHE